MKNILIITLIAFCFKVYGQKSPSLNFKKVKFTYTQKSNYAFDERGVYADSMLFLKDFPKVKYKLVENPKDKSNKIAFVPYSSLTERNISFLTGLIYHTNILTEGTYYSKSKKTESYCYYCHDDETKKIMTLLNSNCKQDKSFLIIKKYRNDSQVIIDNSVETTKKEVAKSVVSFEDDTKLIGSYEHEAKDFTLTNVVEFDKDLLKYITPIDIFSNSDFGVKKVFSSLYTIELTSITYK